MVNQALEILARITKAIPDAYIGIDRTNYIIEKSQEFIWVRVSEYLAPSSPK